MADIRPNDARRTAVDDVRRVREKIAREHSGDLSKHVETTNSITAEIRAKLKVKVVPPSSPRKKRDGTAG